MKSGLTSQPGKISRRFSQIATDQNKNQLAFSISDSDLCVSAKSAAGFSALLLVASCYQDSSNS
jgi:hypothetical protein